MSEKATHVMHDVYLPFPREVVGQHFVHATHPYSETKHLDYYQSSLDRLEAFQREGVDHLPAGKQLGEVKRARQVEKDERFWALSALLSAFHSEQGAATVFAGLLRRAMPEHGCGPR
jgi:hypothetical protein